MSANKFSTFSEEVGYLAQAMFFLTLITEEISYLFRTF